VIVDLAPGTLIAALATLLAAPAFATAELRVVDPDSRPVAGARVETFVEGGPSPAFSVAGRPLASALTGPDGVAPVHVPAVDGVALIVDHPDYPPELLEGPAAHSASQIRLDAVEPWVGRIEPAEAGAEPEARLGTICAAGRFELRMGGRSREWRRCASVAADGGFRLAGLPGGPLEVEVLVPGFLRLARTVTSREGEGARLGLERGVLVTGRITDPRGRGVTGARVEADGAVPAEADAGGRFALAVRHLPAEILAGASGYRSATREVTATGPVELRLEPAEQIAGTLLGDPGETIREVEIWFRDVVAGSRNGGTARLPAVDGEFRLDLEAPGSYLLRFLVSGYRELVQGPVEVGPGRSVSLGAIQLSRGAGVRGVLADAAEGTPLAGVIVEALPVGGLGLGVLADGRGGEGVVSDSTGAFTLAGLDPGRYHVRWRRDGYGTVHRLLDLEGDGLLELGTMFLGGGIELFGVIRDPAGRARPELAVQLYDAANEVLVPMAETTSDAEGAYRLEPVGAGRYRMQVGGEHVLLAQEIEIAHGAAEQRLDLTAGGGRVRGRLTYRGVPVAGGRVTLTPAFSRTGRSGGIRVRSGDGELSFGRRRETAIGEVGEDGSFTLDDAPAGLAWLAYANLAGERRAVRSVAVPDRPGEELRIDLAGRPLEGRVVDPGTGLGVEARLFLYGVTGQPFANVASDPDGGFRFEDLEDGRYDLDVLAPGRVSTRLREVEVSGSTAPLAIELAAESGEEGRIEVVLRRVDGTVVTPVSGVPPLVFDEAGRRSTPFRVDGDRAFAVLPAGEYQVGWSDPLHGAGVARPVRVSPLRRPVIEELLTAGASVVVACPAQHCAGAPVELLTVHSPEGADLTPLLSGIRPALHFSDSGEVSIGRLSPGRYAFRLWVDGEQWESEETVGTGEVRVRLP
jgi:protocatechuate 3,4-dioxygenase beta subunit